MVKLNLNFKKARNKAPRQSRMAQKHPGRLSLMSVAKHLKSIFSATKRKPKPVISTQTTSKANASNEASPTENLNTKTESTNFVKMEANILSRSMTLPARIMTPSNQITDFAKMKASPNEINKNALTYFITMIIMMPVGVGLGLLILHTSFVASLVIGVGLALGTWFLNYYNGKRMYNAYAFQNQYRFNKLLTVLDLSELKTGYSINALLSSVAGRFNDKKLSDAVRTLNSRIQDDTQSPMPYLEFANEFSTTQRARLFMLSVYRMAQGNYDDSEIRSIKHSASKDLTFQSRVLMKKKIHRFDKLGHMQFIGFILFFITYVLYFIGLDIFDVLKGAF